MDKSLTTQDQQIRDALIVCVCTFYGKVRNWSGDITIPFEEGNITMNIGKNTIFVFNKENYNFVRNLRVFLQRILKIDKNFIFDQILSFVDNEVKNASILNKETPATTLLETIVAEFANSFPHKWETKYSKTKIYDTEGNVVFSRPDIIDKSIIDIILDIREKFYPFQEDRNPVNDYSKEIIY